MRAADRQCITGQSECVGKREENKHIVFKYSPTSKAFRLKDCILYQECTFCSHPQQVSLSLWEKTVLSSKKKWAAWLGLLKDTSKKKSHIIISRDVADISNTGSILIYLFALDLSSFPCGKSEEERFLQNRNIKTQTSCPSEFWL